MLKRNLISLAFAAVLAVGLAAPAAAQNAGAQTQVVETVSLSNATFLPGDLKPQNIDGSEPNKDLENRAAKVIQAYQQIVNEGGNVAQARVDAISALNALMAEDGRSLTVRTWLGYLHLQNGEYRPTIDVLTPALGKSSEAAMNYGNLQNVSIAYYMSGQYANASGSFARLADMSEGSQKTRWLRFAGSSHLLNQDYQGAIPFLEKAVAAQQSDSEKLSAMKDLGLSYFKVGREKDALALFERIEAVGANDEGVLSWMGYAYLSEGRADDAVRVLERARSLGAKSPDVLNNLGNAYSALGTDAGRTKALEAYRELARVSPNIAAPHYNIGSLLMQMGRYEDAIEPLKKGVSLTPTNAQGSISRRHGENNLGYCYEQLGKFAEAAKHYSNASDQDASNAIFARNAGLAHFKAHDHMSAIKYLERAEGRGELDLDAKTVLAESYNRANRTDEALKIMKELASSGRANASIWFNIGVLSTRAGDKETAEKAYREALKLEPADPDALNNLGLILFEKGQYEEALVLFEKMTGASRNSIDGKLSMAAALTKAGRLAEAVELWKEVIREEPDRVDVRLLLADGEWNVGQISNARFHYATVLKAQPNNARALNGMGLWYLLQAADKNASKMAEDHFRKAIANDPNYLPPYNNLAITLERMNRTAEAILILQKALKIDPNFEDAKKNLARLKSASM